jgi:hypothetical protein
MKTVREGLQITSLLIFERQDLYQIIEIYLVHNLGAAID